MVVGQVQTLSSSVIKSSSALVLAYIDATTPTFRRTDAMHREGRSVAQARRACSK